MRTTIEAMKMAVTQSIVWVALGMFGSLVVLDYFTPIKEKNKKQLSPSSESITTFF